MSDSHIYIKGMPKRSLCYHDGVSEETRRLRERRFNVGLGDDTQICHKCKNIADQILRRPHHGAYREIKRKKIAEAASQKQVIE